MIPRSLSALRFLDDWSAASARAPAGARAWNISHHDFLMHPRPGFHFLDAGPEVAAGP
ncbi:hypothetical protein ACFVYM_32485 [Streptomyces sp. NPDC058298]|uniref:hypothetical protein n=1 Tax=Streptomyces sp. NPDC058298 TaxID=3346434 RepID=UPI0036E0CBB2